MRRLVLGLFVIIAIGCSSMPAGHSPATSNSETPFPTAQSASPKASLTPVATATLSADLPFPLCDGLHELVAPDAWYRDVKAPPANTNPGIGPIRNWAERQPGFQSLWVDREQHDGWISLAFSSGAQDAQTELATKFPDTAAVVVPVDWTLSELSDLQSQAIKALVSAGAGNVGVGREEQFGVVAVDLTYLEPDLLEVLGTKFAGQRLCVSGMDPSLKPPEGPQPSGGDGWRLLADQDATGETYRTGIAYDDASYARLWNSVGLKGSAPLVDFQNDVVIWFGAVHGSSCPRLRLDGVVVEHDRPLVHAQITELDQGICTADAIAHAYLVALDRAELPHGPFAIQLSADDPPEGMPGERTVVDADLSVPGSTATSAEITTGGQIP